MNKLFLILVLVLIIGFVASYIILKKPISNESAIDIKNDVIEDQLQSPVEDVLIPQPSSAPEQSLLASMKTQLAKKYNKTETDVDVTISSEMPMYAKGMVSFAGEQGGGQWYAYKSPLSKSWELVFDGQMTISCEIAMSDAFPVSMISECIDPSTGDIQQR
jgi:hypothetical protein